MCVLAFIRMSDLWSKRWILGMNLENMEECLLKQMVPAWLRIAARLFRDEEVTSSDIREALEFDKNGVFVDRYLAFFKKRHVPIAARRSKHNCQSRQPIMSRYSKEELKRDFCI
ncbi:hypothetical protein M9H77_24516 [Catharanthus roseus]|uniref:Uncharacterized protein n=2 Tax=Catharanthus roseus TaxID=4058 RepID=A0ACC0AZ47_CATRO|nr:hypothetical protein M9H77_24513 [Catharanthus roseus]KAI5665193.1 hypothetical protein M9H77_24516 [Catharanthus roseus]